MQDLPVRLKRSFEEVCLKYSAFFLVALYRVIVTQDTKLFCLFCQNARSVFHTGTCTNHLITDYFLVYPGGTRTTRATFMCLHLFQLSNLFLPAILSMFEYSTNLFKFYQRSTRFIYNMCVPRIGWCVPGVRCQLVHTCVPYTCTTHACAHLLSTLCTTVNRLSMGGQ